MALAVHLSELGLTADGDGRGDHIASLRVNGRRVAATAVEGENTLRHRLIDDRVGIRAGLDLAADRHHRLEIENRDVVVGTIAGESPVQVVCNRDAVYA